MIAAAATCAIAFMLWQLPADAEPGSTYWVYDASTCEYGAMSWGGGVEKCQVVKTVLGWTPVKKCDDCCLIPRDFIPGTGSSK